MANSNWFAAFAIFDRNGLGEWDVTAGHEEIYVHLPHLLTTSEDGQLLQEMGWFKPGADEVADGEPPDEEEPWQKFV